MGSFDLSCIATRQVIAEDDPCRIFFVRRSSYATTHKVTDNKGGVATVLGDALTVGPASQWKLLSGSFRGAYADYGNFALDPRDEDEALAFLKQASGWLCDVERNYESEDVFSTADFEQALASGIGEAWKMFTEAVRSGGVFARSCQNDGPNLIGIAAIHEQAYRGLLALAEDFRGSVASESLARKALGRMDVISARRKDRPSVSMPEHADLIGKINRETDARESLEHSWPGQCAPNCDTRGKRAIELISEYALATGDDRTEEFAERLAPLLGDAVVLRAMERFAIGLEPSRYAGQDSRNDAGKAYAKLVADTEQKVSSERAKMDGEDFEEDEAAPSP